MKWCEACETTLKILLLLWRVKYLLFVFSVRPKLTLESLERISMDFTGLFQTCSNWLATFCDTVNHSSSTLLAGLAAMCQEAQRIISLFLSLWRPVQGPPLVVDGCKHLFPMMQDSSEHFASFCYRLVAATCKSEKEVLVCCSDHPRN